MWATSSTALRLSPSSCGTRSVRSAGPSPTSTSQPAARRALDNRAPSALEYATSPDEQARRRCAPITGRLNSDGSASSSPAVLSSLRAQAPAQRARVSRAPRPAGSSNPRRRQRRVAGDTRPRLAPAPDRRPPRRPSPYRGPSALAYASHTASCAAVNGSLVRRVMGPFPFQMQCSARAMKTRRRRRHDSEHAAGICQTG